MSFKWDEGDAIIRIASPKPSARAVIDTMKETTDWTAAGTASNLNSDGTVFYEAPSSLRFDLAGAGTGTLTKEITERNLESKEDVALGFLALRIPDGATATDLTSIAFKLGSSSTDYNEVTSTEGFLGAWTAGKWLLVAFDFSAATETGTPDWTALDYVQLSFAHTAAFTNIRVGGLWLALPSPHELIFQTSAIFLDGGTLNKTITDDDDEIILNESSYVLFEHEAALAIAKQQSSLSKKVKEIMQTLGDPRKGTGLYGDYVADNPSQQIREVGNYYNPY